MFQREASLYGVHVMNASLGISPHNPQNIHRLKLISRMNSKIDMTRKARTVNKVIGLGLESGVSISGRGRDFLPAHNVHATLGPSSSGRCIEDCFSGTKRLERAHN
jgi:hypothetical protein